jgi:glycerophosphoryl diester phosphodiesterase
MSTGSGTVIGHRGACGYVPEHTLVSYFIAAQQGVDYIEPDLVMTRDGVLVARHENEIGGTTDVAQHPEFTSRKTTKSIDGAAVEGWFTEDFTLAELKILRARERIPDIRPANTRFDRQFEIPTFEEIMALAQSINQQRIESARQMTLRTGQEQPKPKRIGVYPETKHPSYFAALGLAMEVPLLEALERWDYAGPDASVFIQSFEVGNLKELRQRTHLPLVQLIEAQGQPYDFVLRRDMRSYADLITPIGLKTIAEYADAIGVNKLLIIPRDADNQLTTPTALIRDAHGQGLRVHGWTFRADEHFLPSGTPDMILELQAYLRAGMDGFFTDHPDFGLRATRLIAS